RADSIAFDGPGILSKWASLVANITLTHSLLPYLSVIFSWNSVSWSISTETFFYLAFPLILLIVRRSWWKPLLVAAIPIVALAVLSRSIGLPQSSANVFEVTAASLMYANPLFRGFEFCLGMAACVAWQKLSERQPWWWSPNLREGLAVLF